MLLTKNLEQDAILMQCMLKELYRQMNTICLIPSENIASKAILEAQASCFINKYAEGYPGGRYYEGCEICDEMETICIKRACDLFDMKFANVQPHSGSQANQAVLQACLDPKDTILGMDLQAGGHLTHGFKRNFSGKYYKTVSYSVDPSSYLLDYNAIYELAQEYAPKLIFAGYSSYSRLIDWQKMRYIADTVGAILVGDVAHIAGLIASKQIPSPAEYVDILTTTTHKTLRGPRGGLILTNNEDLIKKINSAVMPGVQGGPLMHSIFSKAVCFKDASTSEFELYSKNTLENAKILCATLQKRGLKIISDGTDNHMMVIDVSTLGLNGAQIARSLNIYGIVTNYNAIPFDTLPIRQTSGVRIGTPFITSCGFDGNDCVLLGNCIADIVHNITDKIHIKLEPLLKKVQSTFVQIYPDAYKMVK